MLAPASARGQSVAWAQLPLSPRVGHAPRYSHAMAYDAARGVTVLFGGANYPTTNGDTWEWNGTVWTQHAVRGPSPRVGHAMAYDAPRGVTLLFGGNTSPGFNSETW